MQTQTNATLGDLNKTTTLDQKMEIGASLALFPALTLMVFIRRRVGYRFLSPVKLIIMTAILTVASIFASSAANATPVTGMSIMLIGNPARLLHQADAGLLAGFALVLLLTGMVKRRLMWNELKTGKPWHTQSRGISLFSFIPLPESVIRRYIDPAVCLIAGLILVKVTPYFSYYIMFSAVCLFIFETWDYEQQVKLLLNDMDSLTESEVSSANIAYYMQGNAGQQPIHQTAGIPTGVAPDIAASIARRRNRRPDTSAGQPAITQQPLQFTQAQPTPQPPSWQEQPTGAYASHAAATPASYRQAQSSPAYPPQGQYAQPASQQWPDNGVR